MEVKAGKSPADRDSVRRFVRLLSRHERSLNAFILSLVPNWHDADEIAQETKVRLWEQFDQFDPATQFSAWARTIAHYQVLTYRKRKRREAVRFSRETLEALAFEADSYTKELGPRHYALEGCLNKLPGRHRELVLQCYSRQESTLKDAAERLGRTYEATRKTLLRVRRLLAECVDRTLQAERES